MKSTIHSWLIWAKSYRCPENSPKLAPLEILQTEKRVKTSDTKGGHIWEILMKGGCEDCSLLPHNIVQKSAWNWGHFESCRQGIRSKGAQRPNWGVTVNRSKEKWWKMKGGLTKLNQAKLNVNVTGVHKKSSFTWYRCNRTAARDRNLLRIISSLGFIPCQAVVGPDIDN